MATLAMGPCSGPLDLVCQLADGVQGAASDYVLGGLGSAFVTGAAQVGQLALAALDSATAIDLGATWFRANVAVIASIALPAVVGLFVIQVLTSVLRREPGGLARAVVGVGKALLFSGLALAVTQLTLTAVDGICGYIAGAAGLTVASAAAQFFQFAFLATMSPALQILLGLLLTVGFLLLWGVLLFRKAALILVAVFAPIAFAGSAWDQTRVWTRRWIEIVAALGVLQGRHRRHVRRRRLCVLRHRAVRLPHCGVGRAGRAVGHAGRGAASGDRDLGAVADVAVRALHRPGSRLRHVRERRCQPDQPGRALRGEHDEVRRPACRLVCGDERGERGCRGGPGCRRCRWCGGFGSASPDAGAGPAAPAGWW